MDQIYSENCEKCGAAVTHKQRLGVYHSQSQGTVERVNGTFKTEINISGSVHLIGWMHYH